jgi:hypothetical protein
MRCSVTVRASAGQFVARSAEVPQYEGRGPTALEAVAHLRAQLLFWLEACPCDQTADDGLVLDVREV